MNRTVIGMAALAGLAGGAAAQNTGIILTDNGATYRIGGATAGTLNTSPTTTGGGPTMDLWKPNTTTPDHLFNDWWWYRTDVDTREFAIANATSRTPVGTNSVIYGYTLSGGLSGTLTYTLTGQPGGVPNAVRVDQMWVITNNNAPGTPPVRLNMFHYLDFDLTGSTSNTATLTTANERMRILGPAATGKGADWWGVGANAYQVTAFATVRGLLTNTVVNDLNNTGLPFGPGDWTGAYQWIRTLDPGASVTILSSYALNHDAIPSPGALALLGLGGLAAWRRRR